MPPWRGVTAPDVTAFTTQSQRDPLRAFPQAVLTRIWSYGWESWRTTDRQGADRSVVIQQPVELSRHPLLSERFTKRMVDPPKAVEGLMIAEQVHDTRMLL